MGNRLLCISGETTKDIRSQLENILKGHLPSLVENGLKGLALSILHSGSVDLLGKAAKARELIQRGAEIEDSDGIFFTPHPWGSSRVAFLFPGQGIRIGGMLSLLLEELVGFREEIEDVRSRWLTLDGRDLLGGMCGEDGHDNEKLLRETENAQPAIGMVSDAVASSLFKLNIQPRFFAGHSFGELSALRAAGALGRDAFLRMSRMRGCLLARAGRGVPGAMTAVMAAPEEVEELLAGVEGTVSVACRNAPEQTVVAGEVTAILELERICRERRIRAVRLRTPCAFHSPLMAPAGEDWEGYLEESSRTDKGFRAPPRDRVFSNVTARTYPEDKKAMTDLLCRHLVRPVRWEEICRTLYERGIRIFVEVGPDAVLTGLLERILVGKPYLGLTCNRNPGDPGSGPATLLARLASHGIPVKWQPFFREATQASLTVREEPVPAPPAATVPMEGFLEGNRRVVESFFDAQYRVLDAAADNVAGEARTRLLNRLLRGNQDVMDAFLSLQQEAGRFLGKRLPFESPPSDFPVAGSQGFGEEEPAFEEGPQEQNGSLPLEDWLRNELSDVTGFPPECVGLDARFDRDFGLESITLLQIFVRMMDLFPETRGLEDELYRVRSIRMLQDLLKDAGIQGGYGRGEGGAGTCEETVPPLHTDPADTGGWGWQEVKGWLSRRLSALSGSNENEITETTDFFDDLRLDAFLYEEIVEELAEKLPEIRVAGYALQNARNMKEIRNLVVSTSVRDDSTKAPTCAGDSAGDAEREPVERFIPVETPCTSQVQCEPAPLPSPMILAGCRGPLFEHFRVSLQDCSLEVVPLCLSGNRWEVSCDGTTGTLPLEDVKGLSQALAPYREGNRIPALLFLAMRPEGPSAPGASSDWIDELEYGTTGLFSLANAVLSGKAENELSGRLFAVIGSREAGPGWRAAAGFTRSLRREWTGVNVRYARVEGRPGELEVRSLLIALLCGKSEDDLVFGTGGTKCLTLVKTPLPKAPSRVRIGPDSLILLTGGGTGVTAALGCMFAQRYQCRIAAVGRTPWPEEDGFPGVTDRAQLKRCIYDEFIRGQRRDGASVQQDAHLVKARFQEIERQRSLVRTAARIKALGGAFSYFRADCTDDDELMGAIDRIHEEEGPICGFIHGAGVTADSLLSRKALGSFQRVVHTKARSSFQLYRLLQEDPLEFVVFLSSLSSYAGTPGQTDYAAANEALNGLAEEWNRRAPYPVKSLLWSVWTETGLAGEGIRKEMERLGLGGIRTADGIRLAWEEISGAPKEEDQVLFAPVSTLQYVMGRRVHDLPSSTKHEGLP